VTSLISLTGSKQPIRIQGFKIPGISNFELYPRIPNINDTRMLLVPYRIETLEQDVPWANWLIIAVCTLTSLLFFSNGPTEEDFITGRHWSIPMILNGWNPVGLVGHIFLHTDIFHLLGNMLFLWVFGNSVCTNIGNGRYLLLFLFVTIIAAIFHNLFSGGLAVGASGAINGVVGVVLALYPINRVHVWYLFFFRFGTWEVSAWLIILVWLAFDIWGVITGGGMVAYWAHIGGLIAGVGLGTLALQKTWVMLTEYDNRSLLEILTGQNWNE
tara:strand:- start:120 stop:932 length:813 start_codon:yes stop_codon:yes gene_type:complete